jgi:hypothetical protein
MGKINIATPTTWKRHIAWRFGGTPCIAVIALSVTTLAIGVEVINGYAKGLAVYVGPFWLGLAVAKEER